MTVGIFYGNDQTQVPLVQYARTACVISGPVNELLFSNFVDVPWDLESDPCLAPRGYWYQPSTRRVKYNFSSKSEPFLRLGCSRRCGQMYGYATQSFDGVGWRHSASHTPKQFHS
jgi:hypothetical protein